MVTAVRNLKETIVPFTATDGFECNLLHVEGPAPPTKGPVMLVHGAGVRANIFRAPVDQTLVDMLVDSGYDVWLENWRASIDFAPNQWTLDQAAIHDHPQAVNKIMEQAGADSIQAVIHCQGSTSFMMGIAAGLMPGVRTVVSNAVSLHPVIPRLSSFKMASLIRLVGSQYPYMNPQWGLDADTWQAKLVSLWVGLTHHECDNAVCKQASFTYGIGFPTLWEHDQLNEATHDWLTHEFAEVPRSFFQQMNRSVAEGALVSVESDPRLPASFAEYTPQTDARFAFLAGELNRCFLPESQQRTYEMFDAMRPNYHSVHVLPGYAHLDVFMGKNAAQDVFPIILDELDKPV
ncbi:MAG: esterase [Dehalococcoidia bacterium]